MAKTLDMAIIELKTEIEAKQLCWRNNPNYDGCMAEDVFGMILALNLISGNKWHFDKDSLTTSYDN